MDRIIELLFNPNHELPSGSVLVVLVIIALAAPMLMNYIRDRRENRRMEDSHTSGAEKTEKLNQHKKKKKK